MTIRKEKAKLCAAEMNGNNFFERKRLSGLEMRKSGEGSLACLGGWRTDGKYDQVGRLIDQLG